MSDLKTILVVFRDGEVARSYTTVLNVGGCGYIVAEQVERVSDDFIADVLRHLRIRKPKIILLNTIDDSPVKRFGKETAELLRRAKTLLPDLRVVLISSYAWGEDYEPMRDGLVDTRLDPLIGLDELVDSLLLSWC